MVVETFPDPRNLTCIPKMMVCKMFVRASNMAILGVQPLVFRGGNQIWNHLTLKVLRLTQIPIAKKKST